MVFRGDMPVISAPEDTHVATPLPPTRTPLGVADEAAELLTDLKTRQNTTLRKLETVLSEHKRLVSERDTLKMKATELDRHLSMAKERLEEAEHADAKIRDLQNKLDAAMLSYSMLATEHTKSKTRLAEVEMRLSQTEARAISVRQEADNALTTLSVCMQAREEAEYRLNASMAILQGKPLPERAKK